MPPTGAGMASDGLGLPQRCLPEGPDMSPTGSSVAQDGLCVCSPKGSFIPEVVRPDGVKRLDRTPHGWSHSACGGFGTKCSGIRRRPCSVLAGVFLVKLCTKTKRCLALAIGGFRRPSPKNVDPIEDPRPNPNFTVPPEGSETRRSRAGAK